jgi:hypothetical protein
VKRIPQAWAGGIGQDITTAFKGVAELLTRIAEPIMRYATVYLAIATALPALRYEPLYYVAMIIVIASPEFILVGALSIAEAGFKQGRKGWSVALFVVCGLLAIIMTATFMEVFKILIFNDYAHHILNFSRCMIAAGFSIVLPKLDGVSPANVQSIGSNLVQIEQQVNALSDQMNLLIGQVQQMFNVQRQEVQSLVQSFVNEQRVNTEPSLNLDELASEDSSAQLNQKNESIEPGQIEPVQKVQAEPQKMNRKKVKSPQTEPVKFKNEPVQIRARRFIFEEVQRTGSVPKLEEIMNACSCSKGSASGVRREFLR